MTHGLINQRLIRIVGMSRSGNHAIINWILAQLDGRWCFLNCAEPKTNPFHSARPTDEGTCYLTNDAKFDLNAHRCGRLSPKDHLLVSHEDSFLRPALGAAAGERQVNWVGRSLARLDVLILRDPYNLFASRRRFGHQQFSNRIMVKMWKQHARTFLGDRRSLAGPLLAVSYNDWASDRDYRAGIAEDLGLAFTDAGFHDIARCGGGSSFDGYDFDGQANRMSLFERWRHYVHDGHFRALFDAEITSLAGRIFGPPPDELASRRRDQARELSLADA